MTSKYDPSIVEQNPYLVFKINYETTI